MIAETSRTAETDEFRPENVWVIHSPRATRAASYATQIFVPLIRLLGEDYRNRIHDIPIEPGTTPLNSAVRFREQYDGQISDKDLVIAGGGDSTASAAINLVKLLARKPVLAFMPLGHQNDVSREIGQFRPREIEVLTTGQIRNLRLLELTANNDPATQMFAASHFVLGAFAKLPYFLDRPNIREVRRRYPDSRFHTMTRCAPQSLRSLRDYSQHLADQLPELSRNGEGSWQKYNTLAFLLADRLTEVIKVPGGGLENLGYDRDEFLTAYYGPMGLVAMAARGFRVSTEKSTKEILTFAAPVPHVDVMMDGDRVSLHDVETLQIRRTEQPIRVLTPPPTV